MSDAPPLSQPQPQPQPPGRDVVANMTENAEAARLKTNGPAVDDATARVQTPHGVSGAAIPSRLPVPPPLLPPPAPTAALPTPPISTPANNNNDDDDDKAVDAMGIGVEVMAPDGTSAPAHYPPHVAPASDPFNASVAARAVTVQGRGTVGAHATATARHKPIAPPEIIDSASYATGVAPPVVDDGESSVMEVQRGPGAPRVRRSPGCLRQAVEMFWRPCLVLLILIFIVLIVAALTR